MEQFADLVETVVRYAQTMTWRGNSPCVRLVSQPYFRGVRLTKAEMRQLEKQIQRQSYIGPNNEFDLGRWFVYIPTQAP